MKCFIIIGTLLIIILLDRAHSTDRFVVRLNYATSNQTAPVDMRAVEAGKAVQNNPNNLGFNKFPLQDTAAEFVSGIERFLETLPVPFSSLQNVNQESGKVLVPGSNSFNNISSTIVKGLGSETAKQGQFPFIASLKREGDHICGGIILDGRHVATAAHCFGGSGDNDALELEPLDYSVTLGEHDLAKVDRNEQDLRVERICVHPEYEGIQGGNDIAIVRLGKRIRYFGNVAPASVPGFGRAIGEGVDVQKGTGG